MSAGQNLAWGYGNWETAIKGWFDEVVDWQYQVGSINGNAVGHYTQASHYYKACP